MELTLKTGVKVHVPIGLPTDGGTLGQGGAQVYLQTEVQGDRCEYYMRGVSIASKKYWSDVQNVFHPFAGVGMFAECMNKTLGRQLKHTMLERDRTCVNYLNSIGHKATLVTDSFEVLAKMSLEELGAYDLIALDQSAATAKHPLIWDVFARLAQAKVKHLWNIDSSRSKIWLHRKTYSDFFGRDIVTNEDYLDAFNEKLKELGYQIAYCMCEAAVSYSIIEPGTDLPTPRIIDLRKELGV